MSQDTRFIDADTLLTAAFGKFETKTALANTSLADNTHYTSFTHDCIFEFKGESGKLARAPSERAQPPSATKDSARGSVLKAPEFQYLKRCSDPTNSLNA